MRDHLANRSRCYAASVRFLRHHASIPTLAKSKPGKPTPMIGPGTVQRISRPFEGVSAA